MSPRLFVFFVDNTYKKAQTAPPTFCGYAVWNPVRLSETGMFPFLFPITKDSGGFSNGLP